MTTSAPTRPLDDNIPDKRNQLIYHILDLLVDGPAPLPMLYKELTRYYYPAGVEVSHLLLVLSNMREQGLITPELVTGDGEVVTPTNERIMLAEQEFEEAQTSSLYNREDAERDEIGLWYKITNKGRLFWKDQSSDLDEPPFGRWVLKDRVEDRTLVVLAESEDGVDEAVRWWLSDRRPEARIVEESKQVTKIPSFTTHDGTLVKNGIRFICKYRLAIPGDKNKA